jgi:putative membrane protein
MFIDYLTLIMINMVAGTVILAYFIWKGIDEKNQRPYAAAFGIVGVLALIMGLELSFTWPLPGSYNVGFGETTSLFGAVFLATGLALSQGWDLFPVSIYAFFAGIDAILLGTRILSLGLTQEPILSAVGFILAGFGGVSAPFFFKFFRNNEIVRYIAIAVLLLTAAIWALTFYGALWAHMASFAKWVPATMATPAAK